MKLLILLGVLISSAGFSQGPPRCVQVLSSQLRDAAKKEGQKPSRVSPTFFRSMKNEDEHFTLDFYGLGSKGTVKASKFLLRKMNYYYTAQFILCRLKSGKKAYNIRVRIVIPHPEKAGLNLP